jgi:hypothetical protein
LKKKVGSRCPSKLEELKQVKKPLSHPLFKVVFGGRELW